MQETQEPTIITSPPEPASSPSAPYANPLAQNLNEDPADITWTASEFIAHEKTSSWYIVVVAGAVVIAVLLYILFRDVVISGVLVVASILFAFYGSHQPRQLEYKVTSNGIYVDQKYYSYETFKSFAVIPDGAFSSIVFMPLKRFGVSLTIYYDPADEDKIISVLDDSLPFEERQPDSVERLMRRIRF